MTETRTEWRVSWKDRWGDDFPIEERLEGTEQAAMRFAGKVSNPIFSVPDSVRIERRTITTHIGEWEPVKGVAQR